MRVAVGILIGAGAVITWHRHGAPWLLWLFTRDTR